MKYILAVSWSTVGFSSLAAAANSVKFINKCPYDIWFWTAGPSKDLHANDEDRIVVPRNGGSVIHGMSNTEELGGGVSLKMRDMPYYQVAPAGIIQVEYHLEPSKSAMWYDLSAVDCNINVGSDHPMYCPFVAGGMKLTVPETLGNYCPPAYCRDDECVNTYIREGGYKGEPSFKCWAGADLFIETCTDGPGIQTFYGKDPKERFLPLPPPPPSPPASLRPSPDETCGLLDGANTGYTCAGSVSGACCSKWGYCGNTNEHCLSECQNGFGHCGPGVPPNVPRPHPLPRTVTKIITSTVPANTITSIFTSISTRISTAVITHTEIQSKTETKTMISTMTRDIPAPTSSVSPSFLTVTASCSSSATATASQSSSINFLASTSNPSIQTSPATRSSSAAQSPSTCSASASTVTVTRSAPASQSTSTASSRSASPSILTVTAPCIASASTSSSIASPRTQYVTVQIPGPTSTVKVPFAQTRTVTGNASGPVVTVTVTSLSASRSSNAASPVTQYVTVKVPGPTFTTKLPITKTTTATQFITQASAIIVTSTITETSVSTYSIFGRTTTTLSGSTITETTVSTYHEPSNVPTSTPRIFRPPGGRPGANPAVEWGHSRAPRQTTTSRKGRRYGADQ